jgi:hypothetical protein
LTINGEQQSLTYEASSYIEDFSYNRNTLERITVSLEKQNKELIILVAVIIVIFSSFIIYARILNRRLFFYDNTKKRKKEKHCDEREE